MSPDQQSVDRGSEFVVYVYVEPDVSISGMQFDLHFDGSVINVKSISEGDLFSSTATTFFSEGTIDNAAGSVIYSHGVILGKEEVTSPGILATIVFEGVGTGITDIDLENVIISNSSGSAVPISVNGAFVTISDTASSGVNSGGTGSGGGGAGDSGELFKNIESRYVSERTVAKGMNLSYTFSQPDNPVVNVNFTPLKSSGSVKTTIEVLKDRSALVAEDPDGLVYRNMNIWVGKYGFATPANIEAMTIGFRVDSSWMRSNDVNSSAIRLNRHSDGKWEVLQTMVTGEEDGYVYFESSTPGFSPFAITVVTSEDGSSGDSAQGVDGILSDGSDIDGGEDQNLGQNMVMLLFIAFLFLAVKRGRDI
ncbi:PGF-pre-PGF domain-containing protein [Methanococcoides sp. FTZ1]|uniref:PGF-pre-PGF domain-containing protein n=1 Tax=Methanococcoides sp. FTZ1 TaxID=3439061 RepID=UPI003F849272